MKILVGYDGSTSAKEALKLARKHARAFGASVDFTYEHGYRPVVNDPALTERLRAVVERTFEPRTLIDLRPTMGGEDFSAYQQRSPGVFAFVGAGNADAGIVHPHHHRIRAPVVVSHKVACTLGRAPDGTHTALRRGPV